FQFRNEGFFVMARKSRGCAEAYDCTPHKQARRLTPPRRKRTVSGWKLTTASPTGNLGKQFKGCRFPSAGPQPLHDMSPLPGNMAEQDRLLQPFFPVAGRYIYLVAGKWVDTC